MLVHVEEADPAQSMLTRDVDLMIRRSDLDRVLEIAEQHGFHFRHAGGLDMLLYGGSTSARNAVRLIFSGEPNPGISPERKQILGKDVHVIPLGISSA